MKRYIRTNSTSDYIRKNQNMPKGGYLYIFKHGIGPGALPRDVEIIRTKDLPNYYTAVWLDRFLTTSEMGEYDIPYETEINKYLDRIGYCQKDGDVVPCDDVEACGEVMASSDSSSWGPSSDEWLNSIGTDIFDDYYNEYLAHLVSDVLNSLGLGFREDGKWLYYLSDEDDYNSPQDYEDLNSFYTKLIKTKSYHNFKPIKKSYSAISKKEAELASGSNSPSEFKEKYRTFITKLLGLSNVEACGDIKASTTNKYFADMVSCSMNGTQAIAYRNIKHCFENLTGEWYNCILDGCPEYIPDSLEEAKQLVYEECLVNKYDKGYCGSGKAPKEMRFAGTQFIRDSIDKLFSEDKDGDVACCAEEKGWH